MHSCIRQEIDYMQNVSVLDFVLCPRHASMHVCFKFSQPTDPNIRPYDENLMAFSGSRKKCKLDN